MQIVPSRKKILLDGEQEEVISTIPHARVFEHNGKTLTAVEHGVEESRVLRNMGFRNVPGPIRHYYSWPGRFTPMQHQVETAEFFMYNPRGLCLNAPGTGKTLSVLWASDYLLEIGYIKKVVIIAPLSTLKVVWGNEFMHHLTHRRFNIVTGDKRRRERLADEPGVDYYIINHDGFTTMPEAFYDADLIVYDEATALKNPSSRRYKLFARYVREVDPMLWLLTGTPIAQNPTDAWTLAKLIGSKTVPNSYTSFKEKTMRRITQFKWVPREDAVDTCAAVLQPSVRFSLDECMDLPSQTYVMRACELTEQQDDALTVLQAEAALEGMGISAPNAAVLFQKMLQVCCGVVYAQDGERVTFDDTNRLDVLDEILEEIGDKVIVYVPLRGVQDRLYEHMTKKGLDVASVHGDVAKKERDRIFDTFQKSDKIQVLLAHPKVASHGLTLTRARSIIWYAPIYSLEMYEQANARIRRLSTTGKTMVFHIAATGMERELYRRLQQRKKILSNFLDIVRGVRDDG